jgi:site-specific DNA recombinase
MPALKPPGEKRTVGMIRRQSVATDGPNEEGSLTTQLQRMRGLIAYKNQTVGEEWIEIGLYDLQTVSGKDSLRTPEFARLLGDIRALKVNTILCTELSRVCRNVREFMELLEVLKEFDVKFASIKEQFDTTTTFGVFVLTILMALAQFEREQAAERTSASTAARTERGLWNGGQLYGFDPDPDRKGYLCPNEAEVVAVEFAMDTYLEHGTIAAAMHALNDAGYRTKAYTSRRGVYHAGGKFSFSTVQHMLKNIAYIGMKSARGAEGVRLVEAVWPAVVDVGKFQRAQALMALNASSKHGAATPTRHTYVLSGGLLYCECGTAMEGRSGTGRLGVKYFYYACRNNECGLRVSASEVEGAVLTRLQQLGSNGALLERLAAETNLRLRRRLPPIRRRRASLVKTLSAVKAQADQLLLQWSPLTDEHARVFATDALRSLADQRDDLERGIAEADRELEMIEMSSVSADAVREALSNVSEVYECLQPYERKELIRLLLQRAEVSERRIVLEIRAGLEELRSPQARGKSGSRSGRPGWLPGAVAHSVIIDRSRCNIVRSHRNNTAAGTPC